MTTEPVLYKKIDPILIASITRQIKSRAEIPPLLEQLRETCADKIDGSPMVIFHGGAIKEGFLIEAAYPVTEPVESGEVHSHMLEDVRAFCAIHNGAHDKIRETVLKIYAFMESHAWSTSLFRREIYQVIDPLNAENNITEVQNVIHEWDQLFAKSALEELGSQTAREVTMGIDAISPETTSEEYLSWIQNTLDRLDAATADEDKKCKIVASCAHVFPQERIDHLREIYAHGTVDDVLHEMYEDDFWYEKPVRRGNIIYMTKNPFDPEGYAKGATPAERRKAYCHCSFVHPYLDEIPSKLSTTFCYCGAGWYRRLWEGILGKPVKFHHVETLLRGNDKCMLMITLPLELEGECLPIEKTG